MRQSISTRLIGCLAGSLVASAVAAAPPMLHPGNLEPPNWSTQSAAAAMDDRQATLRLDELLQRQEQGRLRVVDLLKITESPELSAPDRDRVLFQLADRLSQFNPGDVDDQTITWLANFRPRVLVPHEHATRLGTPLFDVPHAMAATQARWQRQAAVETGLRLTDQPDQFLELWESASAAERHGLSAMAGLLPGRDRSRLFQAIRENWQSDYSRLAVAVLTDASDFEAAHWLVEHAEASALNPWLQQLPGTAPDAVALELLNLAIEQGHQAVAIASLGQLAERSAAARERLAGMMQQPGQATAAAVALASHLDAVTLTSTLHEAGLTAAHPQWALIKAIQKNQLNLERRQP